MIARKFYNKFVVICILPLFSGCSPNIAVQLFNNSEFPLRIKWCNDLLFVQPQETADIKSIYGCSEKIQIDAKSEKRHYVLWMPGHAEQNGTYYYHALGWGILTTTLTIRLQFNTDGKLIALPNGMNFPALVDIPQPDGFPLYGSI